ncbi:MAG: hypothetical protein PUB35_05230 [Campylobacteraceae bacterium]|nr:hypothetical protein [Campylobacteraceae bacterium]
MRDDFCKFWRKTRGCACGSAKFLGGISKSAQNRPKSFARTSWAF